MERRPESAEKPRTAAITALALLGPLFGIATQGWGQALLLLGLAALLIFAPPRRSPGVVWCAIFLAILVIALAAFLPAHWFAIPAWRKTLTQDFRVALPGTLSPQPWLSLHAACLVFAGLVFALYLIAQPWGQHSRRQAARWYAGGIVLLAVLALASLVSGWRPPFWPKVLNSGDSFGLFPNRNQTADVFALAGIMATALALDDFKQRRKAAWFWTTSVVVIGVALVHTFSRAGVLLLSGGIALWVAVSLGTSASRKGSALTIAGLALLLTGFFIFGGGTFERVQKLAGTSSPEYRVGIQTDAVRLAATAPWLGHGLGNFAPVFAMARDVSADQHRIIHPESDWLWVAVEMGWPAVALFAAAFALWLRRCLPLSAGSDRAMRSAAMVCGIAFALHSFGDVSGHRPGSAWPALFLAGLALHPKRELESRRWVAPVFRGIGIVLALISAWWFASVFSESVGRRAPTPADVERLTERAMQQNFRNEHSIAVTSANEALRIAPLSEELYYQRGIARLGDSFSAWGAAWDFATARYLEPHLADLCFSEGKAWLAARQLELAFDAWVEALRRAGKDGPDLYRQMLDRANQRPGTHILLARLARRSPDYFLTFLRQANRLECENLISQLVSAEPKLTSFSDEQRRSLFSVWYSKGDHSLLLSSLLGHAEWRKDGWRWLALLYADAKDFRSACRILRDAVPRPAMPKAAEPKPLAELERIFSMRPDDIDVGLQLHAAQLSAGQTKESLATLHALQALPRNPTYLAYIEATQLEESEDWEQAWKAWLRFGGPEFR